MEGAAARSRRGGGGIFEGIYKVIMRRNSIYVTFVIAGAFLGERAVDYGVHKLWEYKNVGIQRKIIGGCAIAAYEEICIALVVICFMPLIIDAPVLQKRYEDITVLGQRQSGE